MEKNLEAVESEKKFEWWDKSDDRKRIIIIADTPQEATTKLEEFLMDLRTSKVNFDKHK